MLSHRSLKDIKLRKGGGNTGCRSRDCGVALAAILGLRRLEVCLSAGEAGRGSGIGI